MNRSKTSVVVAGISAMAIVIAAVISCWKDLTVSQLPISATQTAEAKLTQIASSTLILPVSTVRLTLTFTPKPTDALHPIATLALAATPTVVLKIPPSVPVKRLDNIDGRLVVTDILTDLRNPIHKIALHSVWSQNGTEILVAEFDQLKVLTADGIESRTIAKAYSENFWFSSPIWLLDGKRIVVHYGRPRFSSTQFTELYLSEDCPIIINLDGTNRQKLHECQADDYPRFLSIDGKWVIAWSYSTLKLYAYEVDGKRRVPFETLGKIQVYDQRYWIWKRTDLPKCSKPDFWGCE